MDLDHVNHRRARDWLEANIASGWASCALTENGYVHIVSQQRYPRPSSPAEAIAHLREATVTGLHRFWTCDVSLVGSERIRGDRVHGPSQVTDVHLVALAVANAGQLVTLDRSIPLSAVRDAGEEHLVVL